MNLCKDKLVLFHFLLKFLFVFVFMKVDSANKYGILLEVVQVLTDLNLIISKAYITSDGGWFMDGMQTSFLYLI